MIPILNNLVFTPENINNSSEPAISIVLRNQEFLTSKASEILIFEEEDLRWSEMEFQNKQFLGYLDNKPCFLAELTSDSIINDETMLTPLRALLGRLPDTLFTICSRSLQLSDWKKKDIYVPTETEKLEDLVEEAIIRLKSKVVKLKIEKMLEQMKSNELTNDNRIELMNDFQKWTTVSILIDKKLGREC